VPKSILTDIVYSSLKTLKRILGGYQADTPEQYKISKMLAIMQNGCQKAAGTHREIPI